MSYVDYTDYLKFPSGRTVGNCRKDAKKLRKNTAVALHTALDSVAETHGIPLGWNKAIDLLLNQSLERVRGFVDPMSVDAIESIAKRNPSLTQYGLGLLSEERGEYLGLTVEEYRQKEHDDLLIMLHECSRALAFVSMLEPQRTVNMLSTRTSYELKHVAEKVFRYVTPGIYVPHGAFIVAALYKGFLPQRCSPTSLSVYFNISEQSPILQWDGDLDDPIASELTKRLEFYSRD
ncbi:hypothetical protein GTP45_02560 [Pseudoduganella sp. FT55W]|uniref:Uncharacterized protein n=1 Tax=Duganella rivi TaxID=2666083 RepID=A0A7X4GNF2_9BURK|nr:hypothetical protein [Duganella rivi]MYM65714.1 hypothetical protein [Duganella rivi]